MADKGTHFLSRVLLASRSADSYAAPRSCLLGWRLARPSMPDDHPTGTETVPPATSWHRHRPVSGQ